MSDKKEYTVEEIKEILDHTFKNYAIAYVYDYVDDEGNFIQDIDGDMQKGSDRCTVGLLGEAKRSLQNDIDQSCQWVDVDNEDDED